MCLPSRPREAHKGDFGRVVVVGGSAGMPGAAALCARAALRSGAGLVCLAVETEVREIASVLVPEATNVLLPGYAATEEGGRRAWRTLSTSLRSGDVVAVGPGWGIERGRRALLRRLLNESRLPLVIDADGLNQLSRLSSWPALVRRRVAAGGAVVLTPHPGEMQRLLDAAKVKIDARRQRGDAARRAAQAAGCVVVFKGAGTIVCDRNETYVNRTGNPGMATGGSGDVLTGMVAGLMAQGLAPLAAAALAVYAHGWAGDLAARRWGEAGLIASDLLEELGTVWRALETKRRAKTRQP